MSNLKKSLYFVGVVLILLISYVLFQNYSNSPFKFFGTVQKTMDSSIVAVGAFDNGDGKKNEVVEVEIKVPSNAKITRTLFVRPPGGGRFNPMELPKETTVSDFSTLKTDSQNVAVGLEIIFKKNFFWSTVLEAKEIKYIAPKY